MAELLFELTGARASQYEVHHVSGLLEVAHDQVLPVAAFLGGLGGGSLGLLVIVLAVDDAREALLGIAANALPHRQYRAAGGVHHDASQLPELAYPVDGGAEGGQEDHVLGGQAVEGLLDGNAVVRQEPDANLPEPPVDRGVMDDVPGYVDAPVRELLSCLEGVVHRPIHPVAEPELLGEAQGQTVGLEDVAVLADRVDDLRAVVPIQEVLHVVAHLEAPAEVLLLFHESTSCGRGSLVRSAGQDLPRLANRTRRRHPQLLREGGLGSTGEDVIAQLLYSREDGGVEMSGDDDRVTASVRYVANTLVSDQVQRPRLLYLEAHQLDERLVHPAHPEVLLRIPEAL